MKKCFYLFFLFILFFFSSNVYCNLNSLKYFNNLLNTKIKKNFLEKANSSLVSIKSKLIIKNYLDFFSNKNNINFNFFLDKNSNKYDLYSYGSGIIIDSKNGYILTNSHVIGISKEIIVKLDNGKEYLGKLIGRDTDIDIAVIKIDNFENLNSIKIGNSDELNIGDIIFSIGYPFNIGKTVTSGIVSGLNKKLSISKYVNFIQTDSIINKGNSGGALLNIKGELVGINTAVLYNKNGCNLGLGFAIPINMINNILKQIINIGECKHVSLNFLGITINDDLYKLKNIYNNFGVFITKIYKNSLLRKYNINEGDIIVSINKKIVFNKNDFDFFLSSFVFGDTINLGILRKNIFLNKKIFLYNKLENFYNFDFFYKKFYGIGLTTYNYLNIYKNNLSGVYIGYVSPKSILYFYDFKKGDIILDVNGFKIRNLLDLRNFLNVKHKIMLFKLLRKNRLIYIFL